MGSDTTSSSSRLTIAISPSFSSDNSSTPHSEPTSDEQPDLGAFTTVLRAWTHFQPPPRIPVQFPSSSSSRTFRPDDSSISSFTHPGLSVASGSESTIPEGSTVWAQRPIQSYLDLYSGTPSSDRLVEEDDLGHSSDNSRFNQRQYTFRTSPPPSSPPISLTSTEGGRTVEIASDVETLSIDDSVNRERSLTSANMTVSVSMLSPNPDYSPGLHSNEEGDNSTSTFRDIPVYHRDETPLRHSVPIHSGYFQRSSSPPSTLLHRAPTSSSSDFHQSQLTPQRSHFPIQEISSPFSSQTTQSYWQSQLHLQSQSTSQPDASGSSYNASHEYKSQANPPSSYSSSHMSYRILSDSETANHSVIQESSLCSFADEPILRSNFVVNESQSDLTSIIEYPHHDESLQPTPESGTHSIDSQTLSLQSQPRPTSPSPDSGSHPPYQDPVNQDYFSTLSESSARRNFSPQMEPPSPLPTPEESESFLFSPHLRAHVVDEEAMDHHTPRRSIRGGTTDAEIGIGAEPQAQRLAQAAAQPFRHEHSYPHSLSGLHGLPLTPQEPDIRRPRVTTDDTAEFHGSTDDISFDATSDHEPFSGNSGVEDGFEQPSLGLLDEALSFIAAERARFTAARESGTLPGDAVNGTLGPGEWRHVVEPRNRKRRRKKVHPTKDNQTASSSIGATRPLLIPVADPDEVVEGGGSGDAEGVITVPPPMVKKKNLKFKKKSNGIFIGDPNTEPPILASEKQITILARPKAEDGSHDIDGNRTPTLEAPSSTPFTLNGKMGKRVGRRERAREKARKDKEREQGGALKQGDEHDFQFNFDFADDKDEEADDNEESEGGEEEEAEADFSFSSSSAGEDYFPRGSAASRAYIHRSAGLGSYKSTPATPGTRTPKSYVQSQPVDDLDISRSRPDQDKPLRTDEASPAKPEKAKKKTRSKRTRTLGHAKSVPDLRIDTALEAGHESIAKQKKVKIKSPTVKHSGGDVMSSLDQSKRGRLLALARKLQALFPEQKQDLGKVITRIGNGGKREADTNALDKAGSTSGKKRRGSGHVRGGSKGSGTFPVPPVALHDNDLGIVGEMEDDGDEELDPRGHLARKDDSLIHIFVDHSNILIGLLSHLKRYPPPRRILDSGKGVGPSFSALHAESGAKPTHHSTPASAFAAVKPSGSRPLPVPNPQKSKLSGPVPIPFPSAESSSNRHDYPIPLPSFATANATANSSKSLSRSLPTESMLDAHMANMARGKKEGVISDGYEDEEENQDLVRNDKKEKKFLRHLWHAALVLILERGRPVSRRVVVTSSPLYQPMDKIERLGYEVRVYLRVPDLGNGMDRERYKDKDSKYASGKSSGGGKSSQSSPVKSISFASTLPSSGARKGHIRHISGSTSTESGSAGTLTYNAPISTSHSAANSNGSVQAPSRIKYREQGVDELLQLKLHQALANTDEVPDGSTIVLATGDGNVGQFNEDGFLGPVRTALRRGWKVELYAWEEGLSRSWRREFGEGSEWSRKGMFRIIGMEQFASGLVEAAGW